MASSVSSPSKRLKTSIASGDSTSASAASSSSSSSPSSSPSSSSAMTSSTDTGTISTTLASLGAVYLIRGPPAAGKSIIATALVDEMRARGRNVAYLEQDYFRGGIMGDFGSKAEV